jgi:hypothetical protein
MAAADKALLFATAHPGVAAKRFEIVQSGPNEVAIVWLEVSPGTSCCRTRRGRTGKRSPRSTWSASTPQPRCTRPRHQHHGDGRLPAASREAGIAWPLAEAMTEESHEVWL